MGECGCDLEVVRCSEHADDVVLRMTRAERDSIDAALRRAIASAIAHYGNEPYRDDPRWTPWTRFGKRVADRCEQARAILRRADTGVQQPDA